MSRIGKKPISIPDNVEVSISGYSLIIKGPKGELSLNIHPRLKIEIKDKLLYVSRLLQGKIDSSLHGLTRTLISNTILGVTQGFTKKLEIQGVGFRANIQGKKLILNLGFSHPVEYQLPPNIEMEIDKEKKNIILIKGIDKQLVGQTAAIIRQFKKPEPYKGKGIKYLDEVIIHKAGKTATKEKTV